jgi:hypothetical protein
MKTSLNFRVEAADEDVVVLGWDESTLGTDPILDEGEAEGSAYQRTG